MQDMRVIYLFILRLLFYAAAHLSQLYFSRPVQTIHQQNDLHFFRQNFILHQFCILSDLPFIFSVLQSGIEYWNLAVLTKGVICSKFSRVHENVMVINYWLKTQPKCGNLRNSRHICTDIEQHLALERHLPLGSWYTQLAGAKVDAK